MDNQRTIEKEASLKGVGIHTANNVNITFKPADADSGINFMRTDLAERPVIKADLEHLLPSSRSPRRTSLGRGEAEVQTIEHLMAALVGLGIDNINIEIDNNEVPGLDGSSLHFIDILNKAGIKEQDSPRQYYLIKEPIYVEEEDASLIALPSEDYKVSYTLSYEHPMLKTQFLEVVIRPDVFRSEIASARTFCLESEAEDLRSQGIGLGANYENTLVMGKDGVIKNKLRFPDEFLRHKVLDLLGDLYILGGPIKGHIIAVKSGHSMNIKLIKKIAQQKQRSSVSGVVGRGYHPKGSEELGVEEIKKILPHRHPFLFVDKIVHLEEGKHATGIKYVTPDDYYFKGHFPGKPVMPGVLIIEAMAQVGGVMMLASEENRGKIAYFMAANNVKFRKTVLPGDELVLDVKAGRIKARTGQVFAKALVGGKVVAEGELMFALADS